MTDQITLAQPAPVMPSERDSLKERAKTMGIEHEANIPTDKLRDLVNARLTGTPADSGTSAPTSEQKPATSETSGSRPMPELPPLPQITVTEDLVVRELTPEELTKQRRSDMRKEALRLVRVRVVPNNPNEINLDGVIISVSNRSCPTQTKFVQFNSPDGYHVPNIILQALREKTYQRFTERKGEPPLSQLVPAYAIEILPNLTAHELEIMRNAQNAAKFGG